MAQPHRSVVAKPMPILNLMLAWRNQAYLGEALLVLIVGFCVYAYTALFSFNPFDSSFLSASYPVREPLNLCGLWGAYLSSIAIYYLGLHSFAAPIVIFLLSRNAITTMEPSERWQKFCGTLGLFFTSMVLIAKIIPHVFFAKIAFPSAGKIGLWMENGLTSKLGFAGSLIGLCTLMLFSFLLCIQRSVVKQSLTACRDYIKELWARSTTTEESAQEKLQPTIKSERSATDLLGATKTLFRDQDALAANARQAIENDDDTDLDLTDEVDEDTHEASEEEDEAHHKVPADYNYQPPPLSIFKTSDSFGPLTPLQKKEFESTAKILTTTFEDFGIKGSVVAIQPGPVVTVFEFQPDAGTKLAKINSLVDDIALSLKVDSIIMHPVRGKRAVGIQVPNSEREMVRLGDILQSPEFVDAASPLTLALGKSISGEPICADLTKMPHLLTAGATGSGKSVAINTLLCSVIMKASPQQVRMILVDPKMLELSIYEGIPHLLMPVITNPERAAIALRWACQEMERRYRFMQHAKVRNITGFNEFCRTGDKKLHADVLQATGEEAISELPFILIVIDELADLMMTAPKEVEGLIQRLAQKARASGIHLVLATQRPSVDIITGVIKANLPCRAAFQVVSKHDSRTILDQIGADKLLGNGDMLFQRPGSNRLERIQGAFISDEEVINLVQAVKEKAQLDYDEQVMRWIDEEAQRSSEGKGKGVDVEPMDDDPKWDEALQIAAGQGAISASFLQRQLKIGYNRAARIVETMESQGLVAKADGAKPRKWLGPSL